MSGSQTAGFSFEQPLDIGDPVSVSIDAGAAPALLRFDQRWEPDLVRPEAGSASTLSGKVRGLLGQGTPSLRIRAACALFDSSNAKTSAPFSTRTPCGLEGAHPARAPAARRVCVAAHVGARTGLVEVERRARGFEIEERRSLEVEHAEAGCGGVSETSNSGFCHSGCS